jgi:hypothetical protein
MQVILIALAFALTNLLCSYRWGTATSVGTSIVLLIIGGVVASGMSSDGLMLYLFIGAFALPIMGGAMLLGIAAGSLLKGRKFKFAALLFAPFLWCIAVASTNGHVDDSGENLAWSKPAVSHDASR